MRKITCLDCEKTFSAETKENAMKQMHPHYMEAHQELMKASTEADKKAWFERFDKAWENAPEE